MVRSLYATAVLVLVTAGYSGADELPAKLDRSGAQAISTDRFKLVSEPKRFVLHVSLPERKAQIVIPKDWLVPPEEEEQEEGNYVSSFNYDSQVTSFAVGNGQIGLHLSSYKTMQEGSAAAAAGRDVFLIYDSRKSVVFKGLMNLGISKERVRIDGCLAAKAAHFLVADINGDALNDLGVVWEELECRTEEDIPRGPVYVQAPIRWFVFQQGSLPLGQSGWTLHGDYSGKFPKDYSELPLIRMVMSPVDFFAHIEWGSYDPSTWGVGAQSQKFMPAYRSTLINRNRAKTAP